MAENPKNKLWTALNSAGYYTKSFDDFDKQFSTPEKIGELYKALNGDQYYTKSEDEFNAEFFGLGKQKEVEPVGLEATSVELDEPIQNTEVIPDVQTDTTVSSSEQSLELPDWAKEFVPEGTSLTSVGRDTVKYYDPSIEAERQVIRPVDVTAQQDKNMSTDMGFWGRMGARLSSGAATLQSGILGIPELLYSLGASPINIIADAIENNGGKDLADMIRVNPSEGWGQLTEGSLNPLGFITELADKSKETSDYYESLLGSDDVDTVGAIRDGDYLLAGERLLGQVLRSGPSLAYLAATGGAGATQNVARMLSQTAWKTLPFSSRWYMDFRDAEGVDQSLAPYYALLSGMVEILDAEIGASRLLRDQILSKKTGAKDIQKMAQSYIEKALAKNGIPASIARGSLSEGIIRLSHNVTDKYSGKNPDLDLKEGILNSMMVGGTMSGIVAGASQAGNFIADKNQRDKVNKLESEIESLLDDAEGADASMAETLNQEVERLTSDLDKAIDEALNAEGMTTTRAEQAVEINDIISEINMALENESLSQPTRDALESRVQVLEEELSGLVTTKEAVAEVDATNPEITAERDAFIEEFRKENPSIEAEDVLSDMPEVVSRTMDRLDNNLPVDPVAAKESSDYLYGKYKELSDMKKDPSRMQTIDEINQQMEALESDIEALESFSTESSDIATPDVVESTQEVIDTPEQTTETTESINQQESIPVKETEAIPEATEVVQETIELSEGAQQAELRQDLEESQSNAILDPQTGENLSEMSDNELAERYVEEYDNLSSLSPVEQAIMSLGGIGLVSRESYARYGDRNAIGNNLARSYFSPDGKSIDVIAQEINSEVYNGENVVTEQDIVDFMNKFPGGSETARTPLGNPRLDAINNEFVGRRGKGTNIRGARALAKKHGKSEEAINAALNHDRIMSELSLLMNNTGEIDLGKLREKIKENPNFLKENTFFLSETDVKNLNDYLEYEASRAEAEQQFAADQGQAESTRSIPEPSRQGEQARTDQEVIQGITDRLKQNGLAKSVKMSNSETISIDLGVEGSTVKGYIDADGNIVINEDTASLDTPIHEFAHAWEKEVAQNNKPLHDKGMELIKGKEGKKYVADVKKSQPHLKGDEVYSEALVQAIGDAGAKIVSSKKNPDLKRWLADVWKYISDVAGISDMTASEISGLNLQQFSEAVSTDLLKGRKINTTPKGDIVMETTATKQSELTSQDKIKADFLNRMRQKNGIKFQKTEGSDVGTLSTDDMVDFVKFTEVSLSDGSVNSLQELKSVANSVGILNQGQIDLAYTLARAIQAKGTVKIGSLSSDQLIGLDYDKLSDESYIQLGKDLVDQGLVDPESLVHSILENPRPLSPHEVTALVYRKSQIDTQIDQILSNKTSISKDEFLFHLPDGFADGPEGMQIQLDILSEYAKNFGYVVAVTAHQQSAAFRLRSLLTDKDYNIVQFVEALRERGELTPELEKKLTDVSNELTKVKSELRKAYAEVDKLNKEAEKANLTEVSKRNPSTRKGRVRTKQSTIDAVDAVIANIDINSFGLSTMTFQANNTLKFSMSAKDNVATAVQEALNLLSENSKSKNMSIADAIEASVSHVNSAVGKGNWNEVGFRSHIVNSLVGEGETVSVKKPYVDSKGVLVVPNEFIRDQIDDMNNKAGGKLEVSEATITDLVEAVKEEVGNTFEDSAIRESISGYGRNVSVTKTELSMLTSQAKNLAKLMSKLDKLRQEGFLVKASKDLHQKFEAAEQLKEEIRMLESAMPMTPEAWSQYNNQRNETRQKFLENYISDLENRIKNKDFAPQNHVREYDRTAKVQDLEKRAAELRNTFKEEQFKWELNNRSAREKVVDILSGLWDVTRMQAGLDGSALMVQGMLYLSAKPKQAVSQFGKSWGRSLTLDDYNQFTAELESDPWFESAKKGGLALQSQNMRVKVLEEQYGGDLFATLIDMTVGKATEKAYDVQGKDGKKAREKVNEYNPWAIAQREYDVFLSSIRLDMFKELMTSQIVKAGVNPSNPPKRIVQEVADAVNMLTAAAKPPLSDSKVGGQVISKLFYSAPKFWSAIKMFNPYAITKMALNNPQLFRDVYGFNLQGGFSMGYLPNAIGKLTAMTVIPTLIANMYWDGLSDEEKENSEPPVLYNPEILNPTEADFLKLRTGPGGNRRISLFNGLDGHVVFLTRSSTAIARKISPVAKDNTRPWERKQVSELAEDYVVNKFSPSASYLYNRFMRTDWHASQAMERTRVPNVNVPGLSFLAPMWATGMFEDYEYSGSMTSAIGLGMLGALGLNYNNYGGAQFANKDGTDNAEVVQLFNRSGISAPTPSFGRKITRDTGVDDRMKWNEFEEVWKPAYDEFMTQASLAKKKELGVNVHLENKQKTVDRLKREAYKYADIKTQGVHVGSNYDTFSSDGVKYRLLKSQFPLKRKYIDEYFKRQGRLDAKTTRLEVIAGLRRERMPANKEYVQMLIDIQLQNKASKYANEKLLLDNKRRKIKLVKDSEHHSGIEDEQEN